MFRAMPVMEFIMDRLEQMQENPSYAGLSDAIEAGLKNLRKWYAKMDLTDIHIITLGEFMCYCHCRSF
jgi:hypothetical protein